MQYKCRIFIDLLIVCLNLTARNFWIQCVILCYRKVIKTALTLLDAAKTTHINFKETKSEYMWTISKMHWQHHNYFSHNSIRRNRRKYTTKPYTGSNIQQPNKCLNIKIASNWRKGNREKFENLCQGLFGLVHWRECSQQGCQGH